MIRSIVLRPDITEMVDWALKKNYLPTLTLSNLLCILTCITTTVSLVFLFGLANDNGTSSVLFSKSEDFNIVVH